MINIYEEDELLKKLNFKIREIRPKINIVSKRIAELYEKLNNLNNEEKFTAKEFKNFQSRYEECDKEYFKLTCELNAYEDCREMLFEIIDNRKKEEK